MPVVDIILLAEERIAKIFLSVHRIVRTVVFKAHSCGIFGNGLRFLMCLWQIVSVLPKPPVLRAGVTSDVPSHRITMFSRAPYRVHQFRCTRQGQVQAVVYALCDAVRVHVCSDVKTFLHSCPLQRGLVIQDGNCSC